MIFKAILIDQQDDAYYCEMTVEAESAEAATLFLETHNPGKTVKEIGPVNEQ